MPTKPPSGDAWSFSPNGTKLGDLGAKALALSVLDAGIYLENIDLSNQEIGDDGALDLATAFMGDAGEELNALKLDGNTLSNDGVEALSTPLSESGLPKLATLSLANNTNITAESTEKLMAAIIDGSPLISNLNLEGNKIETLIVNETENTFETLLYASPNLTSFEVGGNDLQVEELPVLAEKISSSLSADAPLVIEIDSGATLSQDAMTKINETTLNETLGRCSYGFDQKIWCKEKSEWLASAPSTTKVRFEEKMARLSIKMASKVAARKAKREQKLETRKETKLKLNMLRAQRVERVSMELEKEGKVLNKGKRDSAREEAIKEEKEDRKAKGKSEVPEDLEPDMSIKFVSSSGKSVGNAAAKEKQGNKNVGIGGGNETAPINDETDDKNVGNGNGNDGTDDKNVGNGNGNGGGKTKDYKGR
jgi:hypothetical protein